MLNKFKYTDKEIDELVKSIVVLVDTSEKENQHILDYFDKKDTSMLNVLRHYQFYDMKRDYRKRPLILSYTMMGIYKKARNKVGAANFLLWFFQPQTQKEILERKESLGLQTEFFGIAGGFSSVREVNEHILPTFYTQMLSNLPPAQMLSLPNKLPAQWVSYRRMVVEEYLQQNLNDEDGNSQVSMKKLEEEWRKKVFN